MSAAKHTPGPWLVERDRSISAPTPAGSPVVLSEVTVAEVRSGGCASLEQADANARLIAAAPDMLEALQAIMFRIQGDLQPDHEWAVVERELAIAAIAKATGSDA